MSKFIFVSGGVVSGLGKGISAASIGRLLIARGIRVSALKLDPYLNIDPGTMSPLQHGEVFVTEDGSETDLDLGHYERFMDVNLNRFSNTTSGKIYSQVLAQERKGEYLGNTLQVIPHITQAIKDAIYTAYEQSNADVLICEIGGTVGDIESQPFLEAVRQIIQKEPKENCVYIHVTLVPYLRMSKEYKSKPTQHSIKELQSYGIRSDIILTRSEGKVPADMHDKISQFCNIDKECVINNYDIDSLYKVVPMLEEANLSTIICRKLNLDYKDINLTKWNELIEKEKKATKKVKIALVGKYIELQDAYLSVVESLNHAGFSNDAKVEIKWVDSEMIQQKGAQVLLEDCAGILIPGGFGNRGIEGKIEAAQYARENKKPYLGICLGMQIACIEFARHVLQLENANSREFDEQAKHLIIDFMEGQEGLEIKGGTMRLGAYPCLIKKGSLLHSIYNTATISERHRHRYEFNNAYLTQFEQAGMSIAGRNETSENTLVEAIELVNHPFYVAVQFHPEFKSRPNRPHPIFHHFVKSSIK